MKKTSLIGFLLFIIVSAAPIAHAYCPIGNYSVKGWNPGIAAVGAPSYVGEASVQSVGDTCQMSWKIATQRFGGVGFYLDAGKIFTIAYADLKAGWFGNVTYVDKGTYLEGKWVVYGDKAGKLGTEILTKK